MKSTLTFLAMSLVLFACSWFQPVHAQRLAFDLGEANWMLDQGARALEGTGEATASGWLPAEPLILGSLAQTEQPADRTAGDAGADDDPSRRLPPRYVALKGGLFWGTDELSDVDETIYTEIAFGYYLVRRILAVEMDTGFFYNEEDLGPITAELWGVPLFVNVRAGIPVLFLEPYAGIGIGGVYIHTEIINQDDDVVFAGDVFAGLNFNLGDRLFLGAEAKYILTDKTDSGINLTGFAVMASLGFRM
jgi:opacity protein-like surface antigen